jgi:hypothetical protein
VATKGLELIGGHGEVETDGGTHERRLLREVVAQDVRRRPWWWRTCIR